MELGVLVSVSTSFFDVFVGNVLFDSITLHLCVITASWVLIKKSLVNFLIGVVVLLGIGQTVGCRVPGLQGGRSRRAVVDHSTRNGK